MRHFARLSAVVTLLFLTFTRLSASESFQAGAALADITPTTFPAPVNGGLKGRFLSEVDDPMHARAMAMKNGEKSIIFCVVDACMIPQAICDEAKKIASAKTGVPVSHMVISATHTHSAATMAGVFQSDPDPDYLKTLPERIAAGLIQAYQNLEPAELGWAVGSDSTQVFNRRWLLKEGETAEDPFGGKTDRARMNPGYNNPQVSKPAGPIDPDVTILVARSLKDQRPLALFANYSLHYVGGKSGISADYFAAFANEIRSALKADDERYRGKPEFVAIMSNGTSGDINNVNYAAAPGDRLRPGLRIQEVAQSVAGAAMKAYPTIVWQKDPVLASLEADIPLRVRKANPEQLAQAKEWMATIPKDKDDQWSNRKALYARETVLLDAYPDEVPVKLQVHRIGNLSVAAIPCETFVEIGLGLKKNAPLDGHFTISLANAYHGYLPTPEQHQLGGYETWRARSSYLEVDAATKITAKLQEMLSQLK